MSIWHACHEHVAPVEGVLGLRGARVKRMVFLSLVPLAACATAPRAYSIEELASVSRSCGVSAGEVFQDPEQPRFVFLMREGPSPQQLDCVRRWTKRRGLHLGYIDAIVQSGS